MKRLILLAVCTFFSIAAFADHNSAHMHFAAKAKPSASSESSTDPATQGDT